MQHFGIAALSFLFGMLGLFVASQLAKIPTLLIKAWGRIRPQPIRGVFYTQEYQGDTKIVRRYVDGKLSAKRADNETAKLVAGKGTPISDAEYRLDHGPHAEVFKQLRLREQ